jgi:hypothetical protein
MIIENITVAVLTKVNQLAEQYGLKPYDFVAEYHPSANSDESELCFTVAPKSESKQRILENIMDALGFNDEGALVATDEVIIDALDNAMRRAPKSQTGWGDRFSNN